MHLQAPKLQEAPLASCRTGPKLLGTIEGEVGGSVVGCMQGPVHSTARMTATIATHPHLLRSYHYENGGRGAHSPGYGQKYRCDGWVSSLNLRL